MFRNRLNIQYFFSGQRHTTELIPRTPAIANNIGITHSTGDILVLTCPEIWYLNDALNKVIKPLLDTPNYITIPTYMYFDDDGAYTEQVWAKRTPKLNLTNVRYDSVEMPFLMGIWKKEIMDVGGYDEDFTGYALEDNDLLGRLMLNGCDYYKTDAKIVHLYHGARCPDEYLWNNPKWVHNKQLYDARRNIILRNVNRKWGQL
jgi:GT2 family glycosyltransferase